MYTAKWKSFTPAVVNSEGALTCQHCGNDYLHQGDVTLFERHEDEEETTVIAQNGKQITTTVFPSNDTCNPSSRRHGMLIQFICESCSWAEGNETETVFNLAIYQHKGVTFIEWVE